MATGTVADPLTTILAKSARYGKAGKPELLTTHSLSVRGAARVLAARIGAAGPLERAPKFWTWVEQAGLLHDAGKVAAAFQAQLRPNGTPWGQRHEVLSLGFVDALYRGAEPADRLMVATGVAFHHRALTHRSLQLYQDPSFEWERRFGRNPEAPPGHRVQVQPETYEAFLAWFAAKLGVAVPPPDGLRLWQCARERFLELARYWPTAGHEDGLTAALLQGAVTLADHAASGHVELQQHMPLRPGYLSTLSTPYDHQRTAGGVDGHMILRAPTGSGKTEAGLAWAARQLEGTPGEPRLVWTLPYRASIDAIADRFRDTLVPADGDERAEVGILHGKTAHTLLSRACDDDHAPDRDTAKKASAEAAAARLFVHRLRIATPYQLLRAAIAGPTCSSLLIEQANCLFVLDELHAYDPVTFGRICASMRLWEQLGSRVAVLSATLAPRLAEMVRESLTMPTYEVSAPTDFAPERHRLVVDHEPIDSLESREHVAGWLAEGHSVLVVANTVRMAQQLYAALAPVARALYPDNPDAAMLLHSRFRACDRAEIERRLLAKHAERTADEPARRGGGLVVATQTVEVSLCLDFDRGATEVAPVEAVVQRMGRVNRRGRHPEGRAEFRVHRVEASWPYPADAVDVAWDIMSGHEEETLSEQTLAGWLASAYESPWGDEWLAAAHHARDAFAAGFLDFSDPFLDRSDFAEKLEEAFDTVEVVRGGDDAQRYGELLLGPDGHPLLAAELLIPIRVSQKARLRAAGRCAFSPRLAVHVIDGVPYDPETGLDLTSASHEADVPDTVI